MQLNLAIIGVLHAAMALEDPFDNLGLDGIYIDEAVFDIEQALTPHRAAACQPPQPSTQPAVHPQCYCIHTTGKKQGLPRFPPGTQGLSSTETHKCKQQR